MAALLAALWAMMAKAVIKIARAALNPGSGRR